MTKAIFYCGVRHFVLLFKWNLSAVNMAACCHFSRRLNGNKIKTSASDVDDDVGVRLLV